MQAILLRIRQVLSVTRLRPFDVSTESGRAQERYRRVALSALASLAARGTNVAALMITVPLTIKYLGTERYGMWMTMSSIIAMLAIADLGIGSGLITIIGDAYGRDDTTAAKKYVTSASLMLCGIATVLLAVFLSIYPLVPWARVFNVSSPAAIAEAGPAMFIFVVCFVLGIPLGIAPSIQTGYQESFAASLWTCLGSALSLLGVLLAWWTRAPLPWLVFAFTGGSIIARILNAVVLFGWQKPWLLPRLEQYDKQAAMRVLRAGLFYFVIGLTICLAFTSDSMVVTQVLGPDKVAEYSVANRLFYAAPLLLSYVLTPLWPAYSEAAARGDASWVKRTFLRSVSLGFLVNTPPTLLLVIFGKPIIYFWTRHEITPSWLLLIAFGMMMLLNSLGGPLSAFLNGLHVVKFQIACAGLMSVSNLVLSIILAKRVGVAGVVLGTVISQALFTYIPALIYVPRMLKKRFAPPPVQEPSPLSAVPSF
jgi:O-antigen/teichoic acid export membrane protein